MTIWFWMINDHGEFAVADDEEEAVSMAELHPGWNIFMREMNR